MKLIVVLFINIFVILPIFSQYKTVEFTPEEVMKERGNDYKEPSIKLLAGDLNRSRFVVVSKKEELSYSLLGNPKYKVLGITVKYYETSNELQRIMFPYTISLSPTVKTFGNKIEYQGNSVQLLYNYNTTIDSDITTKTMIIKLSHNDIIYNDSYILPFHKNYIDEQEPLLLIDYRYVDYLGDINAGIGPKKYKLGYKEVCLPKVMSASTE